jgi:Tfp pilus assembly protein PilF
MWRNFTNIFACFSMGLILAGCAAQRVEPQASASSQREPVPAAVQHAYADALGKIAKNDEAAAIRLLEEFIAQHPVYPGAYVNLAILYDRNNESQQAVSLLNQAIEIDPGSVAALNRLGLIMRREGKFTEAEAAWLKATEADPTYANAWYNLGILYDIYMQDLPAAIDHYQRYEQLMADADDPLTARWIADLQRRVGEPARAAEARGLR